MRSAKRRDEDILSVGNQMSNVLFNLKQRKPPVTDHDREQFDMLQTKWDMVKRIYLNSFKRKVVRP